MFASILESNILKHFYSQAFAKPIEQNYFSTVGLRAVRGELPTEGENIIRRLTYFISVVEVLTRSMRRLTERLRSD